MIINEIGTLSCALIHWYVSDDLVSHIKEMKRGMSKNGGIWLIWNLVILSKYQLSAG